MKSNSRSVFKEALSDIAAADVARNSFMLAASEPLRQLNEVGPAEEETPPIGSKKQDEDLLEKKDRNIHPFLAFAEYYSDNIFNARDNKESDFVTVISPGIWFNIPGIKERQENPTDIITSPLMPGGSAAGRFIRRYPSNYHIYGIYKMDIERHAKFHSEDVISHTVAGLAQYNFRWGLSVDVADQFLRTYMPRGEHATTELDKYKTNFFTAALNYEAGDRALLRVDYSNYWTRFDASRNDFRDRFDNALAGYVFYRIRPKLAIFGQYEFVDVSYVKNKMSDSSEYHYYGGLRWDITEKSTGAMKVGYGVKKFDDQTFGKFKNLIVEGQVDHKFSRRSSIELGISRATNESDISNLDFILSDSIRAGYLHLLTARLNGQLGLSYTRDRYHRDVTVGDETKPLINRFYTGTAALQYEFREWLKLDVGYRHSRRYSNFSIFDYVNNTIYFRLTGQL
ncbi:MAG: outer membrane beta-barrel protein [Nitrospirae bacterium]|nr:outer membrane beta-barrel protein [Nitrospirota bacterium]